MLALNGTPINELPKDDKFRQHVEAALKQIKKKKHWQLVPHPSRMRPPQEGMPITVREYGQGIDQIATAKYAFDGMPQDITYYERIIKKKDENVFYPYSVDFTTNLPLDPETQVDKIFFMVCVLDACSPCDHVEEFQYVRPGSQYYYQVEDIVGDAVSSNDIERAVSKVRTLIFDDDFGLKPDTIKNLAIHHGIPNAADMDVELVRSNLNKILMTKAHGNFNMNKINAFLEDARDDSLAALRLKVRVAIDKGLIILGQTPRKADAWYEIDKHGEKGPHILTIPKATDKETALVQHLAAKPDNRTLFEAYLKNPGVVSAKKTKAPLHVIEDVKEEGAKEENN